MIIEPISAYENKQATPMFYKKLRKLAKDHGVAFIVDETRTGVGSTGKMWAHEFWYLNNERDGGAPDLVTFGGRAGISGYYAGREFTDDPSLEQNVNMVDVLAFGAMWRAIHQKNFLAMVGDTSSFLKIELNNVGRDMGGLVNNVRGNGTYLGFDAETAREAESIQLWLHKCSI